MARRPPSAQGFNPWGSRAGALGEADVTPVADLSVVIVSWNTRELILRCIAAIGVAKPHSTADETTPFEIGGTPHNEPE